MICFLYFSSELCSVSLSLRAIDHVSRAAVPTRLTMWHKVPFSLSPEPSGCVSERPCDCAFCVCEWESVYLCVKRVEPADYTTCASLCQQLKCVQSVVFVWYVEHSISVRNGRCCLDNPPCAFKDLTVWGPVTFLQNNPAWRSRKGGSRKQTLCCNIPVFESFNY